MIRAANGDVFDADCSLIDVTSNYRPDTAWIFVDGYGHAHQWWTNGAVAVRYSPAHTYTLPSLIWVKDYDTYDEDGEPIPVGHHECRQCGEIVKPGYCADSEQQYIPGLTIYRINGRIVEKSEFESRLKAAFPVPMQIAKRITDGNK